MALFQRGPAAPDDLLLAKAEFDSLMLASQERVDRMKTYRDEGNRVRDPNLRIASTDLSDYGRRPTADGQKYRHRIVLPLGKAMTVKHAYRIAGQLPDVIVDQRDETPREKYRSDTMEKIVWAIMRASKVDTTFASASWHASELGAASFDMYWDIRTQMPKFRAIDPTTLIEVQGSDDPHDFQRVYRSWLAPLSSVAMEYADKTFRGAPVPVNSLTAFSNDGGVEMVQIIQLCDRERVVRFAVGSSGQMIGLYEVFHNYGFAPYVVIPNIGPYDEVWGWADYEFIRAAADYVALLFSREADVLASVAAGAYQEAGTGVSAAKIAEIIGKGGVVPVKRDSKIEPIQPADMPSFAEDHADRGMQLLKMLGFTPDAAWGLPGSGSGTDRGLQLQPLLEYTAMKQLNWQSGLSRMFAMAYKMIEQKMVGTSRYSGSKSTKSGRRLPFVLTLGPEAPPATMIDDSAGIPVEVELPRSPKELFDGDFEVRFVWRNRVDPEDPQYVMSELNKFQTGVQSLETTLENLGIQAPEDEMKRIEKEAERFPWINDGRVSLLMAQLRGNAQGLGGGAPADPTGALAGAMGTMMGAGGGGASGALNADAGAGALGADAVGIPYGGA